VPKEHILVVDDEEDIIELVRYNLVKEGYRVTGAISGEEALRIASAVHIDLILLDLMLPGLDGLEVCRTLKQNLKTKNIPIIMLTAKGEEADIVLGLELGADDYIAKPFSPRVLIARMRTVLRRHNVEPSLISEPLQIHDLVIHPGRFEVLIKDKPAELTVTEFRLLHLLARRPGWVFTRSQIVEEVHGSEYSVSERAVDVQIVGLRKKLGEYGDYIETVRGVGYRFKE
jgi:two-component system, OmpR family, alkaline phosphatase synthesis response regulator PhoP